MRAVQFATTVLAIFFFGTSIEASEVKAQSTLRVGHILVSDDMHASSDTGQEQIKELVGLEVRRALYAGQSIHSSMLGPPTLVKRNEVVVMRFDAGGLGLRAEGRALKSGGVGEVVPVMNLASRLTVRATIVDHRTVEVRR